MARARYQNMKFRCIEKCGVRVGDGYLLKVSCAGAGDISEQLSLLYLDALICMLGND